MALPAEMGLYFDFEVTEDGIPFGCPGLEFFNSTYFGDMHNPQTQGLFFLICKIPVLVLNL